MRNTSFQITVTRPTFVTAFAAALLSVATVRAESGDEMQQIAEAAGVPEPGGGQENCKQPDAKSRRERIQRFDRASSLYRDAVIRCEARGDCADRKRQGNTLIRIAYYYLQDLLQCGLDASNREEALHILRGVLVDASGFELAKMFQGREGQVLPLLSTLGKDLNPDEFVAALQVARDLASKKLTEAAHRAVDSLKHEYPAEATSLDKVETAGASGDAASVLTALRGLSKAMRGRFLAELGHQPERRSSTGGRKVRVVVLDLASSAAEAERTRFVEASTNFRNGVLRELTQLVESGLDVPARYDDEASFAKAVPEQVSACNQRKTACDVLVELRLAPASEGRELQASGAVHIIGQATQTSPAIDPITVPVRALAQAQSCGGSSLLQQQLYAGADFVEQVALRAATYVDLPSLRYRNVEQMGPQVRCGVEVWETFADPALYQRLAELDHHVFASACIDQLTRSFQHRLELMYGQYLPKGSTGSHALKVELSTVEQAPGTCHVALKDGADGSELYGINVDASSDAAGAHADEAAGESAADYMGQVLRSEAEWKQRALAPPLAPVPPLVRDNVTPGDALLSTGLPLINSPNPTIRSWGFMVAGADAAALALGAGAMIWAVQERDEVASGGGSLGKANTLRTTGAVLLGAVVVARLAVFIGYLVAGDSSETAADSLSTARTSSSASIHF